MYKIIKQVETKFIIEKSKFICLVFECLSHEQQNDILKEVRRKHSSATHICFASLIFDKNQLLSYSTDDREPSGTAGVQILQALKEQDMINTLCIVVRYFGGIKLGVAGLGRAYKETALSGLLDNKKEVSLKNKCLINCDYNDFNKIKPYLIQNNIELLQIQYDDKVQFYAYLDSIQQSNLKSFVDIKLLENSMYC